MCGFLYGGVVAVRSDAAGLVRRWLLAAAAGVTEEVWLGGVPGWAG
ncbi:hypothetical protein [Kribbella albertanoniae]|nr:hypothetical protein [Kribbella albertanoniae]